MFPGTQAFCWLPCTVMHTSLERHPNNTGVYQISHALRFQIPNMSGFTKDVSEHRVFSCVLKRQNLSLDCRVECVQHWYDCTLSCAFSYTMMHTVVGMSVCFFMCKTAFPSLMFTSKNMRGRGIQLFFQCMLQHLTCVTPRQLYSGQSLSEADDQSSHFSFSM